jgi:hypothetical protein
MSQETSLVDPDGLLSRKTTAQYIVVRRRFCECIGVPAIDDQSFLAIDDDKLDNIRSKINYHVRMHRIYAVTMVV